MNAISKIDDEFRLGKRLFMTFVLSEFLLLGGNLLVRISQRWAWLPEWGTAIIAIASAVPMIIFAVCFFRMLRQGLDEMVQRVVLEGLAIAMVMFIPLAGLYVNARTAGIIRVHLDPPELLLIPSILSAIGIAIAWSRVK